MRSKTITAAFAVSIALASYPVAAFADTFEYVTASNGQFGTVDLETGAFTFIGDTTGNPLAGIANLGGTLYAVNASNELVTINQSTAASTVIGPTGVTLLTLAGSGGQLFGTDASNNLYSINLLTGAATLIGSTGILPIIANEDYSLAGNGTELFYTEEQGSDGSVLASTLYSINETTAASSTIGLTGIHDIVGAGFTDGTLYGYTTPFLVASTIPSLYTLDTTTGAATFVATLGPTLTGGVFGATTYVPEPGSWVLLLTSVVLLASVRIWRRSRHGNAREDSSI